MVPQLIQIKFRVVNELFKKVDQLKNNWGTDPLPAINPSRPLPYNVIVRATDGGGAVDTQSIAVEISF